MDFGFVKNFVDKIVRDCGDADVYVIAEKKGVSVFYESWYPVTIGEFERNTKIVRVNLRALENNQDSEVLEKTIIAHELGHFFADDLKLNKDDEENFCHEFARILTEKIN